MYLQSNCFVLSTQGIAGIFYTTLSLNNTGHVFYAKSSRCRGHSEPLHSLLFRNVFSSNKLCSAEYFKMPYSKEELTLVGVDFKKAKDSDLRNEFLASMWSEKSCSPFKNSDNKI